jgi:LCP family protein required for cell wall assembly
MTFLRSRLGGAALLLGLLVTVSGCDLMGSAAPTPAPTATAEPTLPPRTDAPPDPTPARTPRKTRKPRPTAAASVEPIPTITPEPTPKPTPMPPIEGFAEVAGSDGRFTLLLLGSDARAGVIGERIDTIMAATIDPTTGRVAMASLPRDTVNVPIANGEVYTPRINGLLQTFEMNGASRKEALRKTMRSFAYAFDTEFDGYVLIGFGGVRRLIDEIGGVDVFMDRALWDPTMHVGKKGLKLKAGWNHLDGNRALAFARTRHTDSDYQRAARQQQLIMAATAKVLENGPDAIPALAAKALNFVDTDLSIDDVSVLLQLAERARLKNYKGVVLGPSTYAGSGPELYTIQMKIDAVRGMFDRLFGPVQGS